MRKYYDDFTEEYHVDSCPVWIDSQLNCQCEQLEIFTRNRKQRGNDEGKTEATEQAVAYTLVL